MQVLDETKKAKADRRSRYPEYVFHAIEPLCWQEGGVWTTRIRRRGEDEYLPGYLVQACGDKCPRKRKPGKRRSARPTACECPYQLHVTLRSRSAHKHAEPYSRLCAWVPPSEREAMLEPSCVLFCFNRRPSQPYHLLLLCVRWLFVRCVLPWQVLTVL